MNALAKTNTQLTVNEQLGAMANKAAQGFIFADYRTRRAEATLRAHDAALLPLTQAQVDAGMTRHSFGEYLIEKGLTVGELTSDPTAWASITWGLVEGFKAWLVNNGLAIATVNQRLTAVRTYAKLAFKAGALPEGEYLRIQAVSGYSNKEGRRVDEKRTSDRMGDKKATHTRLTLQQVRKLKEQPDTAVGRQIESG